VPKVKEFKIKPSFRFQVSSFKAQRLNTSGIGTQQ